MSKNLLSKEREKYKIIRKINDKVKIKFHREYILIVSQKLSNLLA